jgi:hypothetical protein
VSHANSDKDLTDDKNVKAKKYLFCFSYNSPLREFHRNNNLFLVHYLSNFHDFLLSLLHSVSLLFYVTLYLSFFLSFFLSLTYYLTSLLSLSLYNSLPPFFKFLLDTNKIVKIILECNIFRSC